MGKFVLSTVAVNAAADAITSLLDAGRVAIYTAPRPASPDRSPAGSCILLVECSFDDPAFSEARDGAAIARPVASGRAQATGTAAWFRAVTRGGRPIFDGSVGWEGSGADLELASVEIPIGSDVLLTDIIYRQPMEG